MTSQTVKSQSLSVRCFHRTAAGRQCRRLAADPQSRLCLHHLDQQKQKEAAKLVGPLMSNIQGFQTAQGINFALKDLYRLLAENRISTRRAAVLAYINSLILRTLPAIDSDRAAGITDPTIPKKVPAPPANKPAAAPSNTGTSGDGAISVVKSAPVWDASNSTSDVSKKPS